jgi:hypothetical protein
LKNFLLRSFAAQRQEEAAEKCDRERTKQNNVQHRDLLSVPDDRPQVFPERHHQDGNATSHTDHEQESDCFYEV